MLKPDQWALAPNHASAVMLAAGTRAIMTARVQHAERCWQAMWAAMVEEQGEVDFAEQIAKAFQEADNTFGYSLEMVRLVDGEHTWMLKVAGRVETFTDCKANDWSAREAAVEVMQAERAKHRAAHIRAVLRGAA